MKRIAIGFLVLTLVFWAGITCAGDITDASVDKLISLSGLNKQIAELPGMVRMGIEQAAQQDGVSEPDEEFEKFVKSVENAFQPADVLSAVAMEIGNNLSESESNGLITWFESDLGKRIAKADLEASTPDGMQKIMREAQSILADEERMGLSRRQMASSNVVDMLLQLQEQTGLAVITTISKINNPDKPVNVEAFKARLSAQQQQMRGAIEQQLAMMNASSYKNIDINSLEKYTEFLELPTTKKFNNSVLKGMMNGFAKCNEKMVKVLEDLVEEKKKASKQIMLPTTLTE